MKGIDYMTPLRSDNGQYSHNYMEHIVEKRKTAKTVIYKALILAAVIIANIFLLIVTVNVPALMIFPWFLSGILVWWLYRFFDIEYEYVTAGGEIDFDVIYGKKQRKRILTVKFSDMEIIAPLDGNYEALCADPTIERKFDFLISPDAPDASYAIFHHPRFGKSVIFFDVPNKAKNIIRYYNPSNCRFSPIK